MREIKFRALWTDGDSELLWVHGYVVEEDGAYVIYPGGEADGFIIPKEHENTIGQYTGLKDRNGKEIFEGDILGVISACSTYLIEWNKEYGCYTSINTATENYDGDILEQIAFYLLSNMRLDRCEIIGNIHENPELLEVQHE